MTLSSCPNCGSERFAPRVSDLEMRQEVARRERFVARRLNRKHTRAELMDLTRFMHGCPEPLVSCRNCGLILRDESDNAKYATDVYDPDLLEHLYPRYLRAFQQKMDDLSKVLPPNAEVLEVGSHMGAFLEAAENRNWRPTGFDVGESATSFALRRGVRVKRKPLEEARVATRNADAVCIWNCFDQVEEPAPLLRRAYEVLKKHAVLVVRTPNYAFYQLARASRAGLRALGYNNLLGFPYLIGYSPATLTTLVARHGFAPIAGRDSALLTMPIPEPAPHVEREMADNLREPGGWKPALSLNGPWIEIAYRKLSA